MLREIERRGSDKFIVLKSVRRFPEHFRGTEKTNLGVASRWYKDREAILSVPDDEVMSVSHRVKRKRGADVSASMARKDMLVKSEKGRGRKIAPWTVDVHKNRVAEFQRLTKTG